MKSNALSLLCTAKKEAIHSVLPGFLKLVEPYKKTVAILVPEKACSECTACDKIEATVLPYGADTLPKVFAEAREKFGFVLTIALVANPMEDLLKEANVLAQIDTPVFLLAEPCKSKSLEECLGKTYAILEPCPMYLVGTLCMNTKVTKAQDEALNEKFSKQGEAPLFFIAGEKAEGSDFEDAVNTQKLGERLLGAENLPITPGLFELELAKRAGAAKQRIVLAEGEEPRILYATDALLRQNIADIILLGNVDAIKAKAKELNCDIEKATILNPADAPQFNDYANTYYELRKSKGVTEEDAKKTMRDATVFGTMMVKKGDADGMVSGAVNTTAHTIRPALQFVKTKPGFSVVSSCFLMCLKDRVLVFGDCAVNPNPTAEQLAEIAVITADTAKAFGIEPRVAMLSYSTGNSGKGPDVDLVIEATKLAREKDPTLCIDGPLQYDAAFDPTVAKTKMPKSPVAGQATVFIFPNLTCGNNTYKAVQRAANAIAIGPVLQGLNKPVNDLSRGCLVPDIINTVAITAIQAASEKA